MKPAVYLLPVLLASALPCAAGDKDVMHTIAGKVVESRSNSQSSSQSNSRPSPQPGDAPLPPRTDSAGTSASTGSFADWRPVVVKKVASAVAAKARNPESEDRGNEKSRDCTSLASCPFGSPYGYSFAEIWQDFGKLSDSELWEICLGRGDGLYGYRRGAACVMTAYPNPWRPVDVPRRLEHAPAPFPGDEDAYIPLIVDESEDQEATEPCEVNATLVRKRPVKECAADVETSPEGST